MTRTVDDVLHDAHRKGYTYTDSPIGTYVRVVTELERACEEYRQEITKLGTERDEANAERDVLQAAVVGTETLLSEVAHTVNGLRLMGIMGRHADRLEMAAATITRAKNI